MRAGKKWVFNCSYWDDHLNADAVQFMNSCATHWLCKIVMCLKFVAAIVVGVFLFYLQEVEVIVICSGISRFLRRVHHLILRKGCDVLGTGCFSVGWNTKYINMIIISFLYHCENLYDWNVTRYTEGLGRLLVGIFLCWVNFHRENTFITLLWLAEKNMGFKNLGYAFILALESEMVKM